MSYPPSPWHLHGSLWLSVFRLPHDVDELRPAGVYGAAFVRYLEPSPLTYSELLVARATRAPGGGPAVSITDIWVDSEASRDGGRALWAIPKGLARFEGAQRPAGRLATRTSWSCAVEGRPAAAVRFTDVGTLAPRTPFRMPLTQPPIDDHRGVVASAMAGTARTLPARAHWRFDTHGPLAFLREATQLGSARMSDFRMQFGA